MSTPHLVLSASGDWLDFRVGVNYTYDGDGDRVQKSNGKIYWYGAGTEILDESDASGNITDEYVFFGGKHVAHRVVSGGESSINSHAKSQFEG